jgi:hypothetical protein
VFSSYANDISFDILPVTGRAIGEPALIASQAYGIWQQPSPMQIMLSRQYKDLTQHHFWNVSGYTW